MTVKGRYVLLGLFMLMVAIQKLHFEYDLNNIQAFWLHHMSVEVNVF